MPKGLLSNRLNSFQESELAFENSGVGSNGLRSSRIRKTKKIMNVKSTTNTLQNGKKDDWGIPTEECANPSIGRFGTCGPGAAYRVPKKRCSRQAVCRQMQQASDTSGTGLDFDAQVSSWNVNVPTRRCCAPVLDVGTSIYQWSQQ